ncbi:MAG: thiolase family protein [Nitrospira sp.]|nr:thiolase family protein [Candidatus Manganitrophaceae bacterium]HIL34950.1 thiolase family protein [Candidatus Manganitrophaceae bacterium]
MSHKVIIAGAIRTPIGSFQGALASQSATGLGSIAITEVVRQAGISSDQVDEVVMGNVLSAGLGQAPARQAALGAGLPEHVPCTTLNKVCGSGLKAVIMGTQAIAVGDAEIVVAGGMESMTHAPYLLDRARSGYRLGHGILTDSLIHDGLWDVYNDFHMGSAAEACARKYQLSRMEMDDYAIESYRRAREAQESGGFKREIVPVKLGGEKETRIDSPSIVSIDEEPGRIDLEKLRKLRPCFESDGNVTAGNASSLNDGAAALVLMSEGAALRIGIPMRASVVAYTSTATDPALFTTAPLEAIASLLKKVELSVDEIDIFEINEAFASSSLAVIRELGIDPKKVNLRGGAIALGHPIGASGSRILTTLLHLLEDLNLSRGIASLCIGGGEALALLITRSENNYSSY